MISPRPLVYLVGSLRNPEIAAFANKLEEATNYEVFASWFAAGPEADDHWKAYEQTRGRNYKQALASHAATHVFNFDKKFLDLAAAVVLFLPAGRSGHLELGYAIGKGTPGLILLDDPERWDVMYRFADLVTDDFAELVEVLKRRVGTVQRGG